MDGQWSIKSSGGAAASSAICAGGNQPNSQSACGRCAEEGRQTMVGNMQKLVQKAFSDFGFKFINKTPKAWPDHWSAKEGRSCFRHASNAHPLVCRRPS
jgi:hypothetical protein